MHKIIIIFLLVFSFILIKMRRKQIENLSLLTYKDAKYYSLTNKWKCDLLVSEPNNNFINDISLDLLPKYIGKIQTFHNEKYHRDIGTLASLEIASKEFKSI